MDVEQYQNLVWSLVCAIEEHATPRDYDWVVLGVAIVGSAIAAISTFYAVRLYKGQMKIIREQNAISEQQNDIALFDKKYELFKEIQDVKNNMDRTKRFYTKEAIFTSRSASLISTMKAKGENPIFLMESEFASREINSYVSLFAANVLIHRISSKYIDFRRKNEAANTNVSDVIFFLDEINIEVDGFSDRIRKIDFVYNLSNSDKFELYRLGKIIKMIKFFRDKNDTSPQGVNKLNRVLDLFCTHVENMKITNTMNKDLMEMKNKVKKHNQNGNDLDNCEKYFTLLYWRKREYFSLKKMLISYRKTHRISLRTPILICREENFVEVSFQNPFVKSKIKTEEYTNHKLT